MLLEIEEFFLEQPQLHREIHCLGQIDNSRNNLQPGLNQFVLQDETNMSFRQSLPNISQNLFTGYSLYGTGI